MSGQQLKQIGCESEWQKRYSQRHKPIRVKKFPAGVEQPKKVRIYSRGDGYLLQFWDSKQKKTLSQRVEGDLISAIYLAREIDDRLLNFKRSGFAGKSNHVELVSRYLADLDKRCTAGEIDSTTIERYGSAIRIHYAEFCSGEIVRQYPTINRVDRDFQLAFSSCLRSKLVSPNGHPNAALKPMTSGGQLFVQNAVKSMYEWAVDPQRGNLLPSGFINPFLKPRRSSDAVAIDRIEAPEISVEMATQFIGQCDRFQLPIFSLLILYGLRPREPGWLFGKDVDANWARFQCHPELGYFTKGRRDKKFPIVDCVRVCLQNLNIGRSTGLVFQSRSASVETDGIDFESIHERYSAIRSETLQYSAKEFRKCRDRLMRQFGQLNYDQVKREFQKIALRLEWPSRATLKDFRHLFSTCLENAGVPEYFRKYLMGHSFGRAPLTTYTHLAEDKLREHYMRAVSTELSPIVDAIELRQRQLAIV